MGRGLPVREHCLWGAPLGGGAPSSLHRTPWPGTHTAPPLLRDAELFCRRNTRAPRSTAGCVCSRVAFRGWNRDTGPICTRDTKKKSSRQRQVPRKAVLTPLHGLWLLLPYPQSYEGGRLTPNLACEQLQESNFTSCSLSFPTYKIWRLHPITDGKKISPHHQSGLTVRGCRSPGLSRILRFQSCRAGGSLQQTGVESGAMGTDTSHPKVGECPCKLWTPDGHFLDSLHGGH